MNISIYFTNGYIVNRFLLRRILNPGQKNLRFRPNNEGRKNNAKYDLLLKIRKMADN